MGAVDCNMHYNIGMPCWVSAYCLTSRAWGRAYTTRLWDVLHTKEHCLHNKVSAASRRAAYSCNQRQRTYTRACASPS